MNEKTRCWVCSSTDLKRIKQSEIDSQAITAEDFQITDDSYGTTLDIYQCAGCGFLQCNDANDLVQFYENMEDDEYENTRDERALQAQKLLQYIEKFKPNGKILDIGAGSGIFCEEAIKKGYDIVGIEPSRYLQEVAEQRGLPVKLGIFPHDDIKDQQYDVIALIDVIEHVSNPVELLTEISQYLAPNGIFITVTPDVDSVASKLMGWRWWHYRIAHVGYFNKKTLSLTLENAGMVAVDWSRPKWYFPASYLYTRLMNYLPSFMRHRAPSFLNHFVVPLNLFDSYLVVCEKPR